MRLTVKPVMSNSILQSLLLSQVRATKSNAQGIFLHIMGEKYHLVCQLTSLPCGFRTIYDNTTVNFVEYLINSQLNTSYKTLVLGTYITAVFFPSQPILPSNILTGIYCIMRIYLTLTSCMMITLQ